MARDNEELVKIFAGPLVEAELRHAALSDAGIESKVVGTELTGSFGSALADSIELWIASGDLPEAEEVLLKPAKPHEEHAKFPHPNDDPKPAAPHPHKEPHVNPDPHS